MVAEHYAEFRNESNGHKEGHNIRAGSPEMLSAANHNN